MKPFRCLQFDGIVDADMYSRLLSSATIVGPFPSPIALQTTLGFRVSPEFRNLHCDVMREQIENGFMLPASQDDMLGPHYFIPHHGVSKLGSTSTPLHIVFDCSARSSRGKSLNYILHSGLKLQTDIVTILINFRLFPIAVTADLSKMYFQIEITPNHRKFQLLLWRFFPDDPLTPYRFNTVLFRNKSSPYLAIRAVRELASDENNLIRVGGRLRNANVTYNQQHPILLPKRNHLVSLYRLYSSQKPPYWSQISSFHFETKVFPRAAYPLMTDLPAPRVVQAKPFVHTGIDYSGSFYPDLEQNELAQQRIEWKFIPLKASHMGGIWEAQNKDVKTHLRKVVGNQILFLLVNF
ncbi:hypothetical protein ILUMI_12049 [Ignelater luminosus]|uniref:Uncharacterized protein n=1 Tax=Ignelater luminosus TaxID=2038154 RepID=A0A8K0CX93_IGNLU|nr:hypothetical protein ILUMI_12049 [Ignelater luminosus]